MKIKMQYAQSQSLGEPSYDSQDNADPSTPSGVAGLQLSGKDYGLLALAAVLAVYLVVK